MRLDAKPDLEKTVWQAAPDAHVYSGAGMARSSNSPQTSFA